MSGATRMVVNRSRRLSITRVAMPGNDAVYQEYQARDWGLALDSSLSWMLAHQDKNLRQGNHDAAHAGDHKLVAIVLGEYCFGSSRAVLELD
jgi:hypothetical protein